MGQAGGAAASAALDVLRDGNAAGAPRQQAGSGAGGYTEFGPLLQHRITSEDRYRRDMARFLGWAEFENRPMPTLISVDRVLYLYMEDVWGFQCPKSWAAIAVAGTKYFEPRLRTKNALSWSTEAMKSWDAKVPVDHHDPVVFPLVVGIAVEGRRQGDERGIRFSLLSLVGQSSWLRPGELCALARRDVQLPESLFLMQTRGEALLRVAPDGRPSKSGREQPAFVPPGPGLHALRALCQMVADDDEPLGGMQYYEYRQFFGRAARSAELEDLGEVQVPDDRPGAVVAGGRRWAVRTKRAKATPHGVRAGAVTEAAARQMTEEEKLRRGRWRSSASLRSYEDEHGAALAAQRLADHVRQRVAWEVEHLYTLVPELHWGLLPGERPPMLRYEGPWAGDPWTRHTTNVVGDSGNVRRLRFLQAPVWR